MIQSGDGTRKSGASYALKLTVAGAKAIAVDDTAEPEDAGEENDTLANRDQASIPSKSDAKDARRAEGMEPGPIRPAAPRGGSKLARVIGLLERDHGATIKELIAATGWLAHTTRAALTGLRKRGYAVAIDRSDDKRGSFYRIRQVRPASVKGWRTLRRRARRSRTGRSRKPIKRPDGRAPTTAGAGEGLLRATPRSKGVLALDDTIAALVELDLERTLPAMAQPLGRDPSRPFAALAAHEDPSLSHPGHDVRRARQRDAARPAPTEGREAHITGLASFRNANCDKAGRDQAEGRGSARPRMEWPPRACDDPGEGRRLERQDLRQPVAGRQGDYRHKLERPSLLRPAIGQVQRSGMAARRSGDATPLRPAPSQQPSKDGRAAFVRRLPEAARHESEKAKRRCAAPSTPASRPSRASSRSSTRSTTSARPREAYIKSQAHEGWTLIRDRYDDGGFSGGSMERPALQRLLDDVRARRIDVDRRLQGRPADPLACRLRQAGRAVRRPQRLVRLGDPERSTPRPAWDG